MTDFKIFGIEFKVSVGFVGILCLMLYIDKVGLMLPTIIAIIVHEMGHIVALTLFKSKPERIELKVGALGICGNYILRRSQEVIMLAAGSILNIILFAALYIIYFFCESNSVLNFSLVTLVVGIFNILPIIGLDGGSILNILLGCFLKRKTSNTILYIFSVITVMVIILFGFYVFADTKSNISLILLGLYLFLGILMSKKQKNDCKMPLNIVK